MDSKSFNCSFDCLKIAVHHQSDYTSFWEDHLLIPARGQKLQSSATRTVSLSLVLDF